MPTDKHRIAAYLPPEIDEKFQAFKQERGVGDSQALILILSEFLEVAHPMSHDSSLGIEASKGELLSELLSELDVRFGELRGELLSESLKVETNDDLLVSQKVSHELVSSEQGLTISQGEGFTNAQLSQRFGCGAALVRKQKSNYRSDSEKFIAWSKSRDPDGRGWLFDEGAKLFFLVNS